jgi:acetoin:2,6-dichlorophenolindophenol oxidoreductase subunit alpha
MSRPASARRAGLRERYGEMCRIRALESTVARAHRDGLLPGLLHLSIGAEAVAAGVAGELLPDDRVYSSHRPHGHFLAAGASPRELLAELAGRETGMCRGRGGSMHLTHDRAVMATGIVGGCLPIAVGHALRVPAGSVVAVFFGDGAVQTGVFHEALNLAALWRVPVLFVCENNGMAEFSAREEHTKVAEVVAYAELHGIDGLRVDGAAVEQVGEAAAALLDPMRAGAGPALLECAFTRLRPHYEGDWRDHDGQGPDPLALAEELLVAGGADAGELAAERDSAEAELAALLSDVLEDPPPDPAEDEALVFARPR